SLLAFLFGRLFHHLDVDFADLLDGQQALGDEALRDDRLEFVEENVDAVNLAAGVAGDQAFAQSICEIMVDLAENSDIFACDLHATGAGWSDFSVRLDGRGARHSTGGCRSAGRRLLRGDRVAAAHEVATFASDAFDIDILIGLRLDES